MKVPLSGPTLVVLIGSTGAGKTTFAHRHFKATEIVSADACRGLVSDDENNQRVSQTAFEVLHFIADKRLELGKLVVVDATNVWPEDRQKLIRIAQKHAATPVALVFYMPMPLCESRNRGRHDRNLGPQVIFSHTTAVRTSLDGLSDEGFSEVFVFNTPEEVERVTIERSADTGLLASTWSEQPAAPGPDAQAPARPAGLLARLRALVTGRR